MNTKNITNHNKSQKYKRRKPYCKLRISSGSRIKPKPDLATGSVYSLPPPEHTNLVITSNPKLSSLSKRQLRKLGFGKKSLFYTKRLSSFLNEILGRPKYSHV